MSNVVVLRDERAQRATEAVLNDLEAIRERILDWYAGTPDGSPQNLAAAALMTLADRLVAIARNEID